MFLKIIIFYLEITISSIFKIILTTSVANFKAEDVTREGCITFSSNIFVIVP